MLPTCLAGSHFFCDTLDITRPFPSHRAVKDPSWDFVWNRWLTTSFRNNGLDWVCPPLLQASTRVRTRMHANVCVCILAHCLSGPIASHQQSEYP